MTTLERDYKTEDNKEMTFELFYLIPTDTSRWYAEVQVANKLSKIVKILRRRMSMDCKKIGAYEIKVATKKYTDPIQVRQSSTFTIRVRDFLRTENKINWKAGSKVEITYKKDKHTGQPILDKVTEGEG